MFAAQRLESRRNVVRVSNAWFRAAARMAAGHVTVIKQSSWRRIASFGFADVGGRDADRRKRITTVHCGKFVDRVVTRIAPRSRDRLVMLTVRVIIRILCRVAANSVARLTLS